MPRANLKGSASRALVLYLERRTSILLQAQCVQACKWSFFTMRRQEMMNKLELHGVSCHSWGIHDHARGQGRVQSSRAQTRLAQPSLPLEKPLLLAAEAV